MSYSRRSFTLATTFAFLTGTGAGAQDAPALPECEEKTATSGIWQIRSTLRKASTDTALGVTPLGVNTYRHQGDIWVFRRTTPGDDWTRVEQRAALSMRNQEDDIDRPNEANSRLFVSFAPQFSDENGTQTPLIPFGLGATEITVDLSYFIDVTRGDTRDRMAEGTLKKTFKPDDRTHFIALDLPDEVVTLGGDQVIIGLQFSDDFGLGAIAPLTGLVEATAEAQRLNIRAKREVAAGLCAIPAPAGGCFVVTAAHEAGQELAGKPVDLDLILSARDDLLAAMPQYRPAANQYYETAPELVARIGQSNHRHDIYARFVRRAVRPAEWLIRRGLPKLGFVWLGIGIEMLYRKHLPDVPPPSAFAPGRGGA
ncbi:MAG: hypothetical protein AAGM21_04770 [Pseudomonadota bacterium]